MKHARLSASGSKRWIECPGSVQAEAGLGKRPSSVFGMQGTAAHHLADYCLTLGDGALATDFIGARLYVKDDEKVVQVPPRIAEGGKLEKRLVAEGYERFDVVDEEGNGEVNEIAAWAVNMFVDLVREKYEKLADLGAPLVTEQYMDMEWWHPLMGGTADANFMGLDQYIKLFDLKFGSGVTVEVKGNTQLRIYARAIMQAHPEALGVDMWIVQPRKEHEDGPIRHIRYEREELLAFEEETRTQAELTQMPDAPLKAGEHCLFCEAKHTCLEFRRHTQELARMDFNDPPDAVQAPADMDDLARLAEWLPMLDALQSAVHGAIARHLMQGRQVRGFKVVRGKTNRKYGRPADHPDGLWEKGDPVPEDEIVALMKSEGMLSEDMMYKPRELLSLAQMEKLGKDAKAAIKQITYKPEGPLTVAPESDTREAVKVEIASFPEDGDVMELPKP